MDIILYFLVIMSIFFNLMVFFLYLFTYINVGNLAKKFGLDWDLIKSTANDMEKRVKDSVQASVNSSGRGKSWVEKTFGTDLAPTINGLISSFLQQGVMGSGGVNPLLSMLGGLQPQPQQQYVPQQAHQITPPPPAPPIEKQVPIDPKAAEELANALDEAMKKQ